MRILHGDDIQASRDEVVRIKKSSNEKGLEVVAMTGKAINLTTVKQVVESGSLFGADQFLVLEELLAGSKSKAKEEVSAYLKEEMPENVLIWEGRKIDGRRLSGWKVDKKEFKVNSAVFKFLEEVRPGNQKVMLKLYEEVLGSSAVELVFFMLVRQVRQLIEVASDEDGYRGPPWLKAKLKGQADSFGLDGLLGLHEKLFQLELESKTGSGVLPLSVRLELVVVAL